MILQTINDIIHLTYIHKINERVTSVIPKDLKKNFKISITESTSYVYIKQNVPNSA